jgi:hypothetical protein
VTVIHESVATIAGADAQTTFTFSSPALRDSSDDDALITTVGVRLIPVAGVLTTPDLDPGPATVRVGLTSYSIDIPESLTPVRLWPLIQAGLPIPSAEDSAAVRNGGGAARIQVMTTAEYTALVASTTPDPGSIFLVY